LLYDVFICHASEDKNDFVRPLAEALRSQHIEVWYDEFSLRVGDSLRQAIDRGLANSQFGVVVLSPAFFRKRWPQRELNGLVAREMGENRDLVLPIWHGLGQQEIVKHSPPLGDAYAISSAIGMDGIVTELLKRLRPKESPLIVARDFLIKNGVVPPIITDEWWLDVIQFKEGELRYPDLNVDHRWVFPLPFDRPDRGKQRGLNIAWTALQLDWMQEAADQKYCQLTHPERIHRYLRKWPGLLECSRANPSILALYAPQLTIRGFDNDLADVFDDLLTLRYEDSLQFFGYSEPSTIDGKPPFCGEAIAWRHDQFGNYTDVELARSFVGAHTHYYSREVHGGFTCLIWLLTNAARWLPNSHLGRLTNGMRMGTFFWTVADRDVSKTSLGNALWTNTKRTFRFSREVRSDLEELIASALNSLGISESVSDIAHRFREGGFVEGYYDEKERLQESRLEIQRSVGKIGKRTKPARGR
jgi:hypothetical protein